MPHVFKIKCYRNEIMSGRAKVGDTVYLKSRPDVPMTVSDLPVWNRAAGHEPLVITKWMHPSGTIHQEKFQAVELSL